MGVNQDNLLTAQEMISGLYVDRPYKMQFSRFKKMEIDED